jgi:hypothetical protein
MVDKRPPKVETGKDRVVKGPRDYFKLDRPFAVSYVHYCVMENGRFVS